MIVKKIDSLKGTDREVVTPQWTSIRLLLKKDNMGFSFHETRIKQGAEIDMWYKNHLEAVYCIEGEGEIEDKKTGIIHKLEPGSIYALDEHDKHILRAKSGMKMICVFNPPCVGNETHNEEGAYPLITEPQEIRS